MPEPAKPLERVPMTEEEIQAAHVRPVSALSGPIRLAEYDPAWPQLFGREAGRIRLALGDRIVLLEHVGSTSVPGLTAKPRIDMLLVVADSADEASYVPPLEAAGYVLHIREPDWYQHRLFKGPDTDINLHVFSAGCPEIDRVLLFRDRAARSGSPSDLLRGLRAGVSALRRAQPGRDPVRHRLHWQDLHRRRHRSACRGRKARLSRCARPSSMRRSSAAFLSSNTGQ